MIIAYDASTLFNFSGIDTYTRELINAIAESSPETNLKLITTPGQIDKLKLKFGGYKNIESKVLFPEKVFFGKPGRSLLKRKKAAILAKHSNSVDLIHQTNPFNVLKKVTNLVTTVHDLIPIYNAEYVKKYLRQRYREKLDIILKNSRAIIVPSEYVKNELITYNSSARDKTSVVHEAASDEFAPVSADQEFYSRYGLNKDDKFFLYAGRIDGRKNINGIIDSYLDLPKNIQNEYKLILIAGGDHDYLRHFPRIAEMKALNRIKHFNGVKFEDLIKFFSSSYAFLMPSFSEGFGLPILEAFQCGTPVITSNTTSMPEIAGDAAILINPSDRSDLTKAMTNIAESNDLRNSLIEKGFIQAKKFSWEKAAKETLEVYNKVVNA